MKRSLVVFGKVRIYFIFLFMYHFGFPFQLRNLNPIAKNFSWQHNITSMLIKLISLQSFWDLRAWNQQDLEIFLEICIQINSKSWNNYWLKFALQTENKTILKCKNIFFMIQSNLNLFKNMKTYWFLCEFYLYKIIDFNWIQKNI